MTFPGAILSPCTGICELGSDGLCRGCLRSGAEIGAWASMGDAQRAHVMDHVLPLREKAMAEHRPGPGASLAGARSNSDAGARAAAQCGWRERLQTATRSLAAAPAEPGWNLAELDGIALPVAQRQAAVLVGIQPSPDGARVLLTRRHDALRDHGGQVSFPGGRLEDGDPSPADGALREAREEIGLQRDQVVPLGYLDPLLTISGFRVLPLVGWVAPGFVPRPDPREVADAFSVPLDLLLDPAQLDAIDIEFAGRVRRVFQYRYATQRIWGATASILYNLRERLAGNAPRG